MADAFLLRYIFHNWTDKDCVRILKALRPALRQGTKLLVVELLQDHENISAPTWFEDRIFRFVFTLFPVQFGSTYSMLIINLNKQKARHANDVLYWSR